MVIYRYVKDRTRFEINLYSTIFVSAFLSPLFLRPVVDIECGPTFVVKHLWGGIADVAISKRPLLFTV